jgi:hypothetical protein
MAERPKKREEDGKKKSPKIEGRREEGGGKKKRRRREEERKGRGGRDAKGRVGFDRLKGGGEVSETVWVAQNVLIAGFQFTMRSCGALPPLSFSVLIWRLLLFILFSSLCDTIEL